ncbi:MAG: Maf family protein [Balneolaceae bacterium]
MLKIVLASKSPRRKKLLNQIGIIFEVIPSNTEEIITKHAPTEVVTSLALQKATDVASKVSSAFVIGADTIVVLDGAILGKPENEKDAISILTKLSGNTHSVFTGVSFVITNSKKEITSTHSFYEETKVRFSSLSEEEIKLYVASGSPMDKAGAYGIQDDWGSLFVEHIDGDYYNVVGFPLNRFYQELKNIEPTLLESVKIPKFST